MSTRNKTLMVKNIKEGKRLYKGGKNGHGKNVHVNNVQERQVRPEIKKKH